VLSRGPKVLELDFVPTVPGERGSEEAAILAEGLSMTAEVLSLHDAHEPFELLDGDPEPSVVGSHERNEISNPYGFPRGGIGRSGTGPVALDPFARGADGRSDLVERELLEEHELVAPFGEPDHERVQVRRWGPDLGVYGGQHLLVRRPTGA
jgi:hypothetical protein